ncbi:MAG: hypothetical protein WAW88_11395 [Nocardioides sp.]
MGLIDHIECDLAKRFGVHLSVVAAEQQDAAARHLGPEERLRAATVATIGRTQGGRVGSNCSGH